MKNPLQITVICALLTATCPAGADKVAVVPAQDASREAFTVNKRINWTNNFEDACSQARKDNKLVFWMHMLGSMDGST